MLSPLACPLRGGGAGTAFWLFLGAFGDAELFSMLTSGTLPAASRSNGDSWPSSKLFRTGAGGRGLFMSDCDMDANASGADWPPIKSSLIDLPCRELGGGGGFFPLPI